MAVHGIQLTRRPNYRVVDISDNTLRNDNVIVIWEQRIDNRITLLLRNVQTEINSIVYGILWLPGKIKSVSYRLSGVITKHMDFFYINQWWPNDG